MGILLAERENCEEFLVEAGRPSFFFWQIFSPVPVKISYRVRSTLLLTRDPSLMIYSHIVFLEFIFVINSLQVL